MAEKKQVLRIDIKGNEELIKLRQSLQQYQKQLKDLRKEHKDSETLTKSQATEFANLELNVKKTRSEFNKASKSVKGMNDSTKKGIGFIGKMAGAFTAANLATAAFTKASQVLKNAIVGSVETFKEYEFAMSKVKAISGATNEEFLKLDQSAQDLGRSTFFTATEVANLQINFSKLGFTAQETLNAQEAALLTATATGEDLARTATVIGSTLRGFGLDASEAGRVADVMAASFTSSALDIEKFQTAMTKVAPVAKILGLSLEDTTATLGVLTDSGIEASIAGTSLRNIFLKLGDPSSDLAKSIGFTVNSGEEMVTQFKRMAAEGVNVEKMLEIVDVRQVAAIATMIENVDVLERQIGALERSAGAARDMADIVGENLEGATRRFNSALDGLRIILVEKIAPALTSVLSGFTSLLTAFTDLNDVPISEKLESSRLRMNALFETLKDTNTTLSTRKKVIMEINNDYREYLPNLLTEKTTFTEIEQAQKAVNERMLERITLMAAEEKVKDVMSAQLDREKELFDLETRRKELTEQIASGEAEIIINRQTLFNATENELNIIERTIKKLKEKGKEEQNNVQFFLDKAKELGSELTLVNGQLVSLGTGNGGDDGGNGNGGGTTAGDPEEQIKDATALMDAEMAIRNERQGLLEDFANGEIQTKADLNAKLLEMEIEHLQFVKDQNLATGDELMQVEEKLLDARVRRKELEQKADVDRIKQLEETGRLLMEVGKATGENNALTAIGIKVTQAAAVASGIKGLIEATSAPAKQAVAGDPFSAFLRVASMASMMASVIANLKGLLGSGGGREATVTEFANGGLLQGGMFKGASHANGGVKFAVGGRIHEAEGGEAIINKRSTAAFRPILSAINSYNGNGVKFAEGGLLSTGEKFAMGGELKSVQSMISGGGTQRVVLVESDVTSTQNRISALEARASF